MSFRVIPCLRFRLRAGAAWGSIDILRTYPRKGKRGGSVLCTVWSATPEPSMEQAEANARAIVEGLGGEIIE